MWLPDPLPSGRITYRLLASEIEKDVASGRLLAGMRLPPQRELAWKLKVNPTTVARAYDLARERGLIIGEVGRGSFVRNQELVDELGRHIPDRAAMYRTEMSLLKPVFVRQTRREIDFFERIFLNPPPEIWSHPPNQGHASHRSMVAYWLRGFGLQTDIDNITLTNGAQHALHLVISTLCKPGSGIAVERFCDPGINTLANSLGLNVTTVNCGPDGLDVDHLEHEIRRKAVKVLVLNPLLQNPTTYTLSLQDRMRVIALAEELDFLIVEDDVFRDLAVNPPPTMAQLAPDRVFYITSLSKTVSYSLRIGCLVSPPRFVHKMRAAIRANCWSANPLSGHILAELIKSGLYWEMVSRSRSLAKRRMDIARAVFGPEVAPDDNDPLHIWLPLPSHWRAEAFVGRLESMSGILVTSPHPLMPNRHDVTDSIRICLGGELSEKELEQALQTIKNEMDNDGFIGTY
jgi:DNA-binding transcriptional MocR family regulator